MARRAAGHALGRSPRPMCRWWRSWRRLSGGLSAAGLAAIASARKGLCTGHDKREGDSPYEPNHVRWKNLGGATAFRRRRRALVAGDAHRTVLQQEKDKGEMRHTVNRFHGAWGGGSPRKGKMAVIRPIPACTVAGTGGGEDNGTGARERDSCGVLRGKRVVRKGGATALNRSRGRRGVWYRRCHTKGAKEGGPVRCGSTGGVWQDEGEGPDDLQDT
jgi:hypothetical protein